MNEKIKILYVAPYELPKEIEKYNMFLSSLLKDYELNIISENDYLDYSNDYVLKLKELEIKKKELTHLNNSINFDWLDKFKKNENFEIINNVIVDELIDSIIVNDSGDLEVVFKFK